MLGCSTSRSPRVGSISRWPGAEGAEPRQQSHHSTLHGLSSGSGKLAARRIQQAVKIDVGVTKIDVSEDTRKCCKRKDTRLGLSSRAKAKGDIFKSTDQEGEQLGRAILGAS